MRWTLDNIEDYELIKQIYEFFGVNYLTFSMQEILDLLEKNPELENINKHIHRNEGYQKSSN